MQQRAANLRPAQHLRETQLAPPHSHSFVDRAILLFLLQRQRVRRNAMPRPRDYDRRIAKLLDTIAEQGRDKVVSSAEISPNTLRSLTSGRLPWWDKSSSTKFDDKRLSTQKRTKKLWAKSLTRIAHYLDDLPPDYWLETCGLDPADPEISVAVEDELRSIAAKTKQPLRTDIIRRIRYNNNHVDTQVFLYPPFCRNENDEAGFFWSLCDRIIKSINPAFIPKIDVEAELRTLLDQDDCPLIVGVFDTVYRRFQGFDFLPIRGWEVSLAAVSITGASQDSPPLQPRTITWADITSISSAQRNKIKALVVTNEVGHLFLSGHLGSYYKPETLTLFTNETLSNYHDHVRTLLELHRDNPGHSYVFVADEYSCRHLVHQFQLLVNYRQRSTSANDHDTEDFARLVDAARQQQLRAELVKGNRWEFPSYQLAIGSPSGGSYEQSRWFHLLENALHSEIYGSAYLQTATAYGDLMVLAMDEPGFHFSDIPSGARPTYFDVGSKPETTTHFWLTAYKRVFESLAKSTERSTVAEKFVAAVLMLPRSAESTRLAGLFEAAKTFFLDSEDRRTKEAVLSALDHDGYEAGSNDYHPALSLLGEWCSTTGDNS